MPLSSGPENVPPVKGTMRRRPCATFPDIEWIAQARLQPQNLRQARIGQPIAHRFPLRNRPLSFDSGVKRMIFKLLPEYPRGRSGAERAT